MRILQGFVGLLGVAMMSGCSVIKWGDDGAGDYSRHVSLPPLVAEEGLRPPGLGNDRYTVPGEGGEKLNPSISVQTPGLPKGGRLDIQRQGKLYWVAASHKPSVLWPHLKNFWRVNDYALADINQRNGIITTHWTESRMAALKGVEHEYRMRVIPFQSGSRTFITVRSRKKVEGGWQDLAPSNRLEMAMLSKLRTYLKGL